MSRNQVPWIFSGPNIPLPQRRAEKENAVKKAEPKVEAKVESKKEANTQAGQGGKLVYKSTLFTLNYLQNL